MCRSEAEYFEYKLNGGGLVEEVTIGDIKYQVLIDYLI